jgi:rfaE bifunctional protein nucleotidyltransferase chain/domain
MKISDPAERIYNLENMLERIREWRQQGMRIALTNGCFDILHAGHIQLLRAAAEQADKLVVAINSDASVRRLKGNERPLIDQDSRALLIASLSMTDAVILFEEDTPEQLIRELHPDVLIKGGDYTEDQIAGAAWLKNKGGRVVIVPLLPGHSTSGIVSRIK